MTNGAARDLESRVKDSHHQALKLWLRLLSCTTRVEGVIRNRLRSEFATTLPRFDLLAQLEREPEGLTMGELSQRLMVTGANITGITDQLESEGLVKRAAHPTDRRAFAVQLTARGRRQFGRMAAIHEQWVVELFAGWGGKQKNQMYSLLADLKQHLATVKGRPAKRRRTRDRAKEHAA
jgi:DNA-binding MarR family transcriptional regulator